MSNSEEIKEPEEIKEEATEPKKIIAFDRSDILSILAVIVSLSALGVSIYEADILRKQSVLMHEQQKSSVWPYLEVEGSYMFGDRVDVSFTFTNKGVGPAKINSYNLMINGKKFADYVELKEFFLSLLPNTEDMTVVLGDIRGVMAADETEEVFKFSVNKSPEAYEVVQNLKFNYTICYCSIYDECWYLDSEAQKTVAGCP